ncbi:MOSC domain-containing protein [Tepidiforma sp.]|uniref:MOSC domain-containing protein n=1 Tax=Tepidiforma sp. TaxID=2682230 RepID=UPI002ADE4E6E|nr:MOSC domain-containing protein [Tepidiforma sp.]
MSAATVGEIWQFPVKGMAGSAIERAEIGLQGIAGDRLYAFTRADRVTPFPWFTAREFAGLPGYAPSWEPDAEGKRQLVIRSPRGEQFRIDEPRLSAELERLSGIPVRLHADYRGNHDVAQVSIISRATIDAICSAAGVRPDVRRFRMNLVLEGPGAFEEDRWVGQFVAVGTARLAVVARDERCVVTTLDPAGSGERAPGVLTSAGALNGACAGVYAVVVQPGEVTVGERVVALGEALV